MGYLSPRGPLFEGAGCDVMAPGPAGAPVLYMLGWAVAGTPDVLAWAPTPGVVRGAVVL